MQDKIFGRVLVLTLCIQLLFAVWPQLDLIVARWFLLADGTFWLAGNAVAEDMRHLVWFVSLAFASVAAAMLLCTAVLGGRAVTPWRFWAFVTTLYVLGPGLLANLVLKAHWGRARPADVVEFGGALQFTPPFEMTDQCLRNCSFVSGEAAAAAVLAIVLGMVLLPGLQRVPRMLIGLVLAMMFIWVAGQRMASGRHFLSDVVFAGLFMLLMARWLYGLLQVRGATGAGLTAGMRADAALALRPAFLGVTSFITGVKARFTG